jgi:hypothetical protein
MYIQGHFLGTTSSNIRTCRLPDPLLDHPSGPPGDTGSIRTKVRSVHGDLNGPLGLISTDGHLYRFSMSRTDPSLELLSTPDSPTLSHVAIAGNGKCAIIMLQAKGSRMIHILEFASYTDFQSWFADPSAIGEKKWAHFMLGGRAKTLLGGAVGFVLLTEDGEVFSWGDGRHPRCLGRTPNAGAPADKPALVGALGGLKVEKIDGRGWVFAALGPGNSLYIWGRDKPGVEEGGLGVLFGGPDEEVKMIEAEGTGLEHDDVLDFAVGNGHLLLTCDDGLTVWGIGDNRNGQLGVEVGESIAKWHKVATSGQIRSFAVGDLSSLMVLTEGLKSL